MKKKFKHTKQRKRRATLITYALFSLLFLLFSVVASAQDSIPALADLSEEKELKFQQSFFKALAEKSITNYQKAIENLEQCNQVLPNNKAVFFEFSKNYLFLNNTLLAKEYINRAISQDPNNIWMLTHLVEIYKKEANYKAAIVIQEQINSLNPGKKSDLIPLYLADKEIVKAITLLDEIKKEKGLTKQLQQIQSSLLANKLFAPKDKKLHESLADLTEQFENNKSFDILKKIVTQLEKENNNFELEKFSEKGITLFPAQPLMYLIHGKSLTKQQKYKEALQSLKNGIDFVVDDTMEADFYTQMAIASDGIGNANDAKKFRDLAKKTKA